MNVAMALFVVVLAVDLGATGLLFGPAIRGRRPAGGMVGADAAGSAYTTELETMTGRKDVRFSAADDSRLSSSDSAPMPRDVESNTTTSTTTAAAHEQQKQRIETASCRKIIIAAVLASPFLIVRVLYAAIGDFAGDVRFTPYIGDRGLYLGMSVLMEVVAAYICLGAGFAVPPPPKRVKVAKKGEKGESWWRR